MNEDYDAQLIMFHETGMPGLWNLQH